jgi:hypothetical protein
LEAGAKGTPSRRPYHVTKPVSRVLYRARARRWPFILGVRCRTPHATNPGGSSESRLKRSPASRRPYSVLLPVGFAVPSLLPRTRCALTAPFHPYLPVRRRTGRRFAFCCTVPGVAPAGNYPAPCFHGARTFLSALIRNAGKAAIRPADSGNKGLAGAEVKSRREAKLPASPGLRLLPARNGILIASLPLVPISYPGPRAFGSLPAGSFRRRAPDAAGMKLCRSCPTRT